MESKRKRLNIFMIILFLLGGISDGQYAVAGPRPLYPILHEYVKDFYKEFKKIPEARRYRLDEIAGYIMNQKAQNQSAQIFFIGSNQGALSEWAQVWAEVAAFYYRVDNVKAFSAGINPGEVSEKAIFALERAGFIVYKNMLDGGPLYKVKYSYNLEPILVFPKKINHIRNPRTDFLAVLVDANAGLNLPGVKGTLYRLPIEYDDPIGYDGMENDKEIYDQYCRQMALEMFYVFSQLKPRAN